MLIPDTHPMILLCPSAKAAAADPVSFRLSPLHCTVLAFVLRVAWSPPHGRWLIRLYNDERTLHLDLRYFHATGYAPWWRDHLFIGRQDDLCTLAACGLHVGVFVSCHVSILPLASSSTKNATGNQKKPKRGVTVKVNVVGFVYH